MIRIERGDPPPIITESTFQNAKVEYQQFRSAGGTRITQTKLDPGSALDYVTSNAMPYVQELFLGKCAYTEARVESGWFHLHRPEADAYDERLGSSADHYWWTAMWWRNWYLASNEVASLKRNNFPVLGGRADPPEFDPGDPAWEPSYDVLDAGVLLDPCEDRPEWHLRFDDDGFVHAWGDTGVPWLDADNAGRGPETIRLLDLNNKGFLSARRRAVRGAVAEFDSSGFFDPNLLSPDREHIGAIRQALATRVAADPGHLSPETAEALLPELAPHVTLEPQRYPPNLVQQVADHVGGFSPELVQRLKGGEPMAAVESPRMVEEEPTSTPEERTVPMIPRTAAITRIVIKNLQAIEFAEITIPVGQVEFDPDGETENPDARSSGRRWKALLGENGTGKSAALKAIGLALASSTLGELEQRAGIRWDQLLRRGTRQGRVLIEFTGESKIDMRFNSRKAWFIGGAPRIEGFVRGFGATRLLGSDDAVPEANVRLGNLYNPRISVVDAEDWLLRLPEQGDFNVAAVGIAQLLGLHEEVTEGVGPSREDPFLSREGGVVTVGGESLENLSDGYRSVIAMACDLMAGAGEGLSGMENATGIVLIDEIGAHLHPKWKMDITRKMRRIFPSMQFIISTHEPLCLLGLVDDEVIRVRTSPDEDRAKRHAVFDPIPDSPSGYRVDRLLTSEFFGLNTTIDPTVDRQFREYYALVAVEEPTPAQLQRRQTLAARLSQHGVLGYTRRDQMVYAAIDRFLAHEMKVSPEERKRRRDDTFKEIGDIWRNVAERRRARSGS